MAGLAVAFASGTVLVHTMIVVHHFLGRHLRNRKALCACTQQCLTRCRSWVARARDIVTRRASLASAEGFGDAHIMAACVAQNLQSKRVRFMRDGCKIYAQLLSIGVGITIYKQEAATDYDWMTNEQRCVLCISILLSCYLGYRPRNHSKAMLRMWFILLSILGQAACFFLRSPNSALLMFQYRGIVPRTLFSMIMIDANFVSLANMIYSGFVCAVEHWRENAPADTDIVSSQDVFLRETFTLFGILACVLAFQGVFRENSQKAIELKASRSEASAAVKVVNVMCHAAVQLDDRLRVADQETKLAALLMHEPGRVLTGSSFRQYFRCEDEHRSFLKWLEAPKDSLDEGKGFAAGLRDRAGNPVFVDMFHVPFEWLPGEVRHFIGIRERAADDVSGGAPDAFRTPDGMAETHPEPSTDHSAPPDSAFEVISDTGSDIFDSGYGPAIQEVDGHPAFKLNAATLCVTGCSAGASLVAQGALKPGTFLPDRLCRCETNDLFFNDYAKTLGALLARARGSEEPVEVERTTAMLVRHKGSYDHFRLDVKLSYHSHWAEDSDRLDHAKPPCVEVLGVLTVVAHEHILSIDSSSSSKCTLPRHFETGDVASLRISSNRASL